MTADQLPQENFEEDLFHFDEVTAAAVRAPLALETEPAMGVTSAAAPIPAMGSKTASMPTPEPIEGTAQRATTPTLVPAMASARPMEIKAESQTTHSTATAAGASTPVVAARGKLRLSPWTWAALSGAAVMNLAVVGLCWKSLRAVQGAVVDIGHQVMSGAGERVEAAGPAATPRNNWSMPAEASSAQSTLERVESELEAGQYSQARQRLYTLLAVCDRLEVDDREEFEVRSRFLLAESWRRQAAQLELELGAQLGEERP